MTRSSLKIELQSPVKIYSPVMNSSLTSIIVGYWNTCTVIIKNFTQVLLSKVPENGIWIFQIVRRANFPKSQWNGIGFPKVDRKKIIF